MASITCAPSTSTNQQVAPSVVDACNKIVSNQRRERPEMLSKRRDSERVKEMFLKRPSELRSRRTPKNTIIRLSDLDQKDSEQCLEEESPSKETASGNATADEELAGPTTSNSAYDSGLKSIEVPLLSLVINKRRGKSKAMLDEYDVIPKPGSRAIITLDDEDQEFLDGWAPEYYVEPHQDQRYPLYSDVLRGTVDIS